MCFPSTWRTSLHMYIVYTCPFGPSNTAGCSTILTKMIFPKIIHMKILLLRGRLAFQIFLSGRSISFVH